MKLIRFGEAGRERPGLILPEGRRIDASAFTEHGDYDEALFGSDGLERLARWAATHAATAPLVPETVRLGPPLARPSRIVCVGLNYRDHARESGMALQHVAGYVLHNDYSERAFQLERGGQWVKGKSCDSFAPLGPFLATPEEVGDVHDLRLWLKVNGATKQCGSTRDLIFDVPTLVSYISQFMTLLPGDIISTGTPFGVGLGHNPPRYLVDGDVVELGIDGLGSARQRVRGFTAI